MIYRYDIHEQNPKMYVAHLVRRATRPHYDPAVPSSSSAWAEYHALHPRQQRQRAERIARGEARAAIRRARAMEVLEEYLHRRPALRGEAGRGMRHFR